MARTPHSLIVLAGTLLGLSLSSTLAGCSEAGLARTMAGAPDAEELDDSTDIDGQVRIDVFPPEELELTDPRGLPLELRPQTFLEEAQRELDVQLILTPTIELSGRVTGTALTPWPSAEVPSVDDVLADAELEFSLSGLSDSVQQPRALADADGRYRARIVPSDLPYDVAILPVTSDVPVRVVRLSLDGSASRQDLHVDAGVPVWGTVTDPEGAPLPDLEVVAVGPSGHSSAPARTDARGRYELIVAEESEYTLVVRPSGSEVLPEVRTSTGVVSASGARADVQYGNDIASVITGVVGVRRIVDGDEVVQAVSEGAVRVRLVAESLDGFPDGNARFEAEFGTNESGRFTELAPRGTYRVEIAPQTEEGPSPLVIEGVRVGSATTTVNGLELERKTAREGVVVDDEGAPVGLADVTCTELGFAERTFATTADPEGAFVFSAPMTPMICTVTPPSGRSDLAITRQRLDSEDELAVDTSWVLRARRGSVLTGQVRTRALPRLDSAADETIAGAVVQVRDTSGNRLGTAVTNSDGTFQVRIDR